MRTSVNVPDELLDQARKVALEQKTTVTEMVCEGLREQIARCRRRKPAAKKRDPLPTHRSGGLLPGVDLNHSAALWDLLDGFDDSSRR